MFWILILLNFSSPVRFQNFVDLLEFHTQTGQTLGPIGDEVANEEILTHVGCRMSFLYGTAGNNGVNSIKIVFDCIWKGKPDLKVNHDCWSRKWFWKESSYYLKARICGEICFNFLLLNFCKNDLFGASLKIRSQIKSWNYIKIWFSWF